MKSLLSMQAPERPPLPPHPKNPTHGDEQQELKLRNW